MFLETVPESDYLFSTQNSFETKMPVYRKKQPTGEMILPDMNQGGGWTKRRQRQLAMAEFYRKENARLRKPCPHCTTLVQPHLLGQHYDAYHPTIPSPVVIERSSEELDS